MKFIKIFSLIIVIALTSVSCGFIRNELGLGEKTAIKFNDIILSQEDLDADFKSLAENEVLADLAGQSDQPFLNDDGELSEDFKIRWANVQLGNLVFEEARKDKDLEVTDEDKEQAEEEAKNTFAEQQNSEQGSDVWEAFDEGFQERLIDATAERVALLNSAPEVTDEEVSDYFATNEEQFTTCESDITTRHILVETQQEAQEVKDELDAGADFGELAAEKSQDPGSKDRGGDLGCFVEGQFVAPFNEAVESLDPGQISAPVETDFGFHIIQPQEFEVPTVADVSDLIKSQIAPSKEQEIYEELNERLKDADVFVDEKYGKIVIQQEVPTIVSLDFEETPATDPGAEQVPELTEEQLSQIQEQQGSQEGTQETP